MKHILQYGVFLWGCISSGIVVAEANYVYHEQTQNTITSGCSQPFMSAATNAVYDNIAVTIGFKVEYQFYTDQVRVYYTTDGSTPSGAYGTGSGTTQVLVASYACTSSGVDVCTATIPALPAGTVVTYIVSAWHSGGGSEIFGNGPGSPCSCGTPTSLATSATVFQYTVQAPLPVSLTAFSIKAVQQQVQLEWTTTSEQDNSLFYIERTTDLRSFVSVAQVAGHGTVSAKQHYYFTDETPLKGISYYRLKQMDTNGHFSYSPIRSVIIRANGELVIINPLAVDQVTISGLEDASILDITDLQGRFFFQKTANSPTVTIKTTSWPNNQYLLRITESVGTQARKIIVQH
ncbi:T9SS type A sorting domain-containing protein [Spirosoma sp. SC4-14]|uniref:T9SS type A sorting domain-containing protein n=1 Tax=Spirosoma sp. SC4-14 TaxID=3128900 RepID=UPI0030CE66B4